MRLLLLLALVLLAGILLLVLRGMRQARALRQLLEAITADAIEPAADAVPILSLRAILTDTSLRRAAQSVPILRSERSVPAELRVTDWGLSLHEDGRVLAAFPHARITDAVIIRTEGEPLLRLDWQRGGHSLRSTLRIEGGIRNAELVRREIHLRSVRTPPS